ncbi:MAG: hypothetical protein KDA99_25675, partial [Planctomycetales bacterium]|nr:hypothetical protein [Planctomycetales bacterium]
MSAAITGLEETQDRLARLYESLDSLSYPSRGGILFSIHSIFREMLLLPIHQIDEFANLFQFSGHRLLNGSAGIRATSTNPIVSIPRVSLHTQPGVYPITSLVEAGTEHPVSLSIATEWVVSDVAVSINDVDITLSAGMSKGDVVNRINEFSENTHVFATSWDITKPIQLYATSKDTAGTITVGIDPTVAGNTIGWIERLSFNPNAIVEIGGLTVEGTSGIFIPPDGPIAGTIVR